jgi:hypothetical protein
MIDAYINEYDPDTHPWQEQGRRGHYWVLTPDVLLEAVAHEQPHWELVAREDIDSKVGNGFTLVFRVNKPAWKSRPITVMGDALSEYIVTTPNGSYVPEGYAQGGNAYIPAGFFVPRVDAE